MSSILASNVGALRRSLGDNQTEFAERLKVHQSYISKWERGGVEPSGDSMAALADLAGVTYAEFKTLPWASSKTKAVAPDIPPARQSDSGETVEIIMLDLSVSMGPGTAAEDYPEAEPVQFDLPLLRQITRTPETRLRLIKGIGESMQPTLLNADRVMVDLNDRQMSRLDGIYWIDVFGAQGIKRLKPIGRDRIEIVSDNATVSNQEIAAEDLVILGRAIWVAREL